MKYKLLVLSLVSMISYSIAANNLISKHFLFTPQSLSIGSSVKGIQLSQIKLIDEFLSISLKESSAGEWTIGKQNHAIKIKFQLNSNLQNFDEYHLSIKDSKIEITAKNKSALQYGKQSLSNLIQFASEQQQALPEIQLTDWADFERRGYMLDISRDKVPSMESLYQLIDQLASWRINELQLYTEHTFAYRNHQTVWKDASPLTAKEIQELDRYCQLNGIDLVPNQNSFGHMENWLKHDEYLSLSECETDCKTKWGNKKRTALAPTNPNSFALMQELYAELLPNFSSKYANIGGDETLELGLGKSKALCDQIGKGQVYLNFLTKLNNEVIKNGKQTQFWGDIVLNHPDLIKDIPKNMTALVWGYDATYPFDENLAKFHEANLEFYVCPGTSSWRSEIGKNHNAFLNLKHAAIEGKKYGAKGYLITDWGDFGHFQPKAVSYPSLLLGANYAWNYTDSSLNDLDFRLNKYVFQDSTNYTAKALLRLGNAYLKAAIPEGNANAFHLMIRRYKWTMQGHYQTKHLNKVGLLEAQSEINLGLEELKQAAPQSIDGEIILEEVKQAAQLALFGIQLGLARLDAKDFATVNIPAEKRITLADELAIIIENHKRVWKVRNREGGLKDSAAKLEELENYLRL